MQIFGMPGDDREVDVRPCEIGREFAGRHGRDIRDDWTSGDAASSGAIQFMDTSPVDTLSGLPRAMLGSSLGLQLFISPN